VSDTVKNQGGGSSPASTVRLYLSAKTVDHHVSAILDKIAVGDRGAAARWYREARAAK